MTTTPTEFGHAGEASPLSSTSYPDALEWFRYLQQQCPVFRDDEGRYVLTRYDDVYAVLRNESEEWSSHHELLTADHPTANTRWLVYADDPEHRELRKLINRGWTPTAVTELEPYLRANLDEALATIEPGVEFDVYPIGYRYITQSFADALGLPVEQRARMNVWTQASFNFARPREQRPPAPRDPGPNLTVSPEFEGHYLDMKAYFSALVDKHRDHDPRFCKDTEGLPPFPRAIVKAAKDQPENLDIFLQRIYPPLHLGGVSTVKHIFPNMVEVLLEHPHAWEMLKNDPSLIAVDQPSDAVEEMLRLRSAHAGLHKRPRNDIEIRGTVIPKGSMVQLYYVAADHDPEVFEDPDEFKLRGMSRHLAFGFGTHTCMGQSFVRLAVKIFLEGLLEKFGTIERGSEAPDWSFTGTYFTPPKMLIVGRA
jgi:beta-dihydromenaquinone-9 omega-hydroxylase